MELVIILFIAILLFGANKIPKLARSTGEAMGEFKKGREQVESELQEMREGATLEDESDLDSSETGGPDSDVDADVEAETETETDEQ